MGLRVYSEEKKAETIHDGIPDSYYNSKAGKAFTWKQVAAHNTIKDCWIIVRGSVYDVTKFTLRHPGGRDLVFYALYDVNIHSSLIEFLPSSRFY